MSIDHLQNYTPPHAHTQTSPPTAIFTLELYKYNLGWYNTKLSLYQSPDLSNGWRFLKVPNDVIKRDIKV